MAHSFLETLLILLAAGTLLVALFHRLGMPPILGYLVTGVLIGPHALGWLTESDQTRLLAELGIVFLMFTIGMELSLGRLSGAKRLVLGLGSAQVIITSLLFGLIAWWLGQPPAAAFIIGAALALSSTAIVLKQLREQMELPAGHGRVAVGVLLFQDLAVVPFLIVLSALADDPSRLGEALGRALFKATGLFLALVLVGRKVLPPLLHWVAGRGSRELFMLTALLLALGASWASGIAGLSPTLGAFMAGFLLGETLFKHQLEADIQPFRDLMLGLFFVTIGMQFDPAVLWQSPVLVLSILGLLLAGKTVLIAALTRAFGHDGFTAWRAGLSLSQGGEFGLLLLSLAVTNELLRQTPAQVLLAALILSMAAAPLLLRFNGAMARRLTGQRRGDLEERIAEQSGDLKDHVIICGYGRVGQNLATILQRESIPTLALDLDPPRIRQATAAGRPVVFGDAARPGVLQAAGLGRARALAVTFDDADAAMRIAGQVRLLRESLPILVRGVEERHEKELIIAGAEVFPEGLEGSLLLAGQLMVAMGISQARVEEQLGGLRAENYRPLRTFFHASDETADAALDYRERVRSVTLNDANNAVGRTPEELRLDAYGVELLNVRRGGLRVPGKILDTKLRGGDVLVLKGRPESLEQSIACLIEGDCSHAWLFSDNDSLIGRQSS